MYESEAINRGCPIFLVILFSAKNYLIYIENNDSIYKIVAKCDKFRRIWRELMTLNRGEISDEVK